MNVIINIIIIISFLKIQDHPTGIPMFRIYLRTRPSQTPNVQCDLRGKKILFIPETRSKT